MKFDFMSRLLISIFFLAYFNQSIATENITGIWVGNLSVAGKSEEEEKKLGDIYFSIHQTENDLVVVILSATEKTGDLYASTYIGTGTLKEDVKVNVLTVYGDNAYFPDYDFLSRSLKYVENPYDLWLRIENDGRSGQIFRDSGTASLWSFVLIKKIL